MIYPIEFKITVTKMLTEVRQARHEQSEHFDKEIENIFKITNRKIKVEEYNN